MRKVILIITAVVFFIIGAAAQNRTISGKVTDEKGIPVANASVILVGTNIGTKTDEAGNFTINTTGNEKRITISSVDFKTQSRLIVGNTLNVTLEASNSQLEEVLVVGYQTIKRAEATGSIAKVSGQELAQKPIANFTQNLQGKLPGVQVTGQSGRPGVNAYIRIRGTGSINASNEPLIIIDGITASSVAFNQLNPDDIEDVVVLKDAASQAIYGSRAANGVLVITTKRGKVVPEIRYSFQYGRPKALELKNIHLMNSAQKLEYEYEGNITNPILDSMIGNRITSGVFPAGTTLFSLNDDQRNGLWTLAESRGAGDWSKYLLQNGKIATHELSISGASANKFRYYSSFNKSDNDGVSYGSYFNRIGGRLNAEFTATNWLKVGSNIAVSNSKENNVRSLFNTQSAYTALFLFNPYEPVYLADGKTYNTTHEGYSPLEGTDNNPSYLDRVSTFGTFYAELKLSKALTFKSQIGINYNTLRQENYLQPGSNLAKILGYNSKTDAGNQDYTFVITNTGDWKKHIGEKHNVDVLLGQEFTKNDFYSYLLTGRGFPTASVTTLDNAGSATAASTSRSDYSLSSYFASIRYDYDRKYFLNLSGRRDGSSRFGANNRFANFWAIGTSWDIIRENFLKNSHIVSNLKLRASIGTAGTVPSGLYDNLGVYSLTTKYSDLPTAVPARLPNPDLTWEENKNYDFGVDFGFFGDRLTGTVDYYHRKTNKLIYPRNVSYTTGFSSFTSNIGNLENKGYEISLIGAIVRQKDVLVNLYATYTHNDNKILKLFSDNVPQSFSQFTVGQPLYTYFLNRWAGVNPVNGKNLFYKADGSITEIYSASDAVLLKGKSPLAKWYGSFGTNITFKSFDMGVQFYYSGGNYIFNAQYQVGAGDGEGIADEQFTDALNYWKKPGDIVNHTNLKDLSQRTTFDTDKYLEKGDYISLRDITIGFTTPASIMKGVVKSFRFYVQGTNLWIGTKFRGLPEVGEPNGESSVVTPGLYNLYAQPQLRAITVGIDVKF